MPETKEGWLCERAGVCCGKSIKLYRELAKPCNDAALIADETLHDVTTWLENNKMLY